MLIVAPLRRVFISLFSPYVWSVALFMHVTCLCDQYINRQCMRSVVSEQVMAGSGHLQTLRLLKFLRNRNSTEGHSNYGAQMAVSNFAMLACYSL